MTYIIGGILLIIVLLIIGLILRKRIYDEVDRQERWKMDIMNRNIAAQLSRIKKLNLSGETQERFESWKDRWETIITRELPHIEEYLFDTEEAADRYRFFRAKKIIQQTDEFLNAVELKIEEILKELDELMETEEKNRQEIEKLEPKMKELRKTLSQNRYLYGKADTWFEKKLDDLGEQLTSYYELVETGNYLEANELVSGMKEKLDLLVTQLEEFPDIHRALKDLVPAELEQLLLGIKEMKDDGYRVEQFDFEKEIKVYQERLQDYISAIGNGELKEVKKEITEIEDRIKEMYNLLEKEAIAKSYIDSQIPSYEAALNEITTTFEVTKAEMESLKQTYYFDDHDMESYLTLEKSIHQTEAQFKEWHAELENDDLTHTDLREQLENAFQQLKEVKEKHVEFKQQLHNLRKDELAAKEKFSEMRQEIQHTLRKLEKSNLPGVPNFIYDMIVQTQNKNDAVMQALEKQPLDMAQVQQALNEAKDSINHMVKQTDFMMEQARLTEHVIQYANRYRSRYPILAAKLSEAEKLFRSYEYELALEEAAKAVEEVEPGALKRIEETQINYSINL